MGGVEEAREAWFQGFLPKAKYDMILEAAARDVVAERATTNTLVVFSKKTCPPCVEIKIMLQEAGKICPIIISKICFFSDGAVSKTPSPNLPNTNNTDIGFTKEQTNVVTISDWPTMDKIQEHFVEITGQIYRYRIIHKSNFSRNKSCTDIYNFVPSLKLLGN